MPDYATESDADELYPDEGEYSVVCIDEFKAIDDEEYIQKLHEFDSAEDVVLPSEKEGYIYYVYEAGGEQYTREEWVAKVE